MKRLLFFLPIVLLLAAGCGGGSSSVGQIPATSTAPPTTTKATTTAEPPMTLELFFLAPDGQLVAASRTVEQTKTPGAATLHELMNPEDGTTTQVLDGLQLTIDNGRAHVTGAAVNEAALAQIVYSLTTFPTVKSVNGKTRADVEAFSPAILVEHPGAHEAVTSRLHVTGTANTFEATFNYRLEDAVGKVLAKDFVTATSGTGTRGTFDFSVPFTVDSAQEGTLVVFELSAENGSVIHERRIPLRLTP
jgi:germination protein M